ncbi:MULTISPECIES: thioredoxin domain-containing protein [Nocardioides]|uniref:Thioredoxin domain-containing protein n=1 Tax=Nocardioides abyssi TaxID=3058370 RepID=A0ABT8EVD5_9ACTN|nr:MULTISPECIES: thioredoxin domain-containing protein [Nocardioides]MDN4161921.1 thioredoxin domain-containing protein [Nocardioides abyssi]WKN46606.1 thioredoxin domain-containing protein [Nocardioides sp. Arc9.136]
MALIVSMVAVFFVAQQRESDGPRPVSSPEQASAVVREDSRILGEKGTSGTTFVEFLDFECEACGAAFPVVEELREKYAGEVTFVVRYFPLPGHFNAERAARAVEAAARQGEFEALYTKMYETQSSWGEAQEPHDDLFRGFAEDLGLDMAKFDADYASKEVADRVQRDVDDGLALGVQGTPTFYIDGQPFQPQSIEDFHTALDEAIKK